MKHSKNTLLDNILRFRKYKLPIAVLLIVVGVLGLVLPIIPGIVLLLLGMGLIKKKWFTRYRQYMKQRREQS